MKKFKSRKNSIVTYVIFFLTIIILLQSVLSYTTILNTDITSRLESFTYHSFATIVESRKDDLERFMKLSWNNISTASVNVSNIYEEMIGEDGEINEADKVDFLRSSTDIAMEMMSATGTTGAFVILDDGNDMEYSYSSIYLKSDNYLSQTVRPENLMLAKGPTEISKEYGFSLLSSWSYGLELNETNIDILTKPMEGASSTNNIDYLGYWHISDDITSERQKVLTYSIPILDADGNPVGVVGVEISQSYLYSLIPLDNFGQTRSYHYVLATLTEDDVLTPIMTSGYNTNQVVTLGDSVQLEKSEFSGYDLDSPPLLLSSPQGPVCVSAEKISMYPNNSPFGDSNIWLVGMVHYDDINYFTIEFWDSINNTFIISVVCGILLSYFVGRKIASPILKLNKAVSTNDVRREIEFSETSVTELDNLADVIKKLQQQNITHTADKTDRILDLLNIGVGSFEFIKDSTVVNVSQAIHKMLDVYEENCEFELSSEIFFSRVNDMKTRPVKELKNTYASSSNPPKYYTIDEFLQDDAILGIIEDSTKEVNDLKALNYERNYDVLTGIFNRRSFHNSLEEIFKTADMKVACFVMFDLDNLKYVNDTFGHEGGDRYIKSAAGVLSDVISDHGVVGRMSGDQFYAFLYGFDNRDILLDCLHNLYQKLEKVPAVMPDGKDFQIRMSGGIAWYGDDSSNIDELMKYADFAMYKGKQSLKGELREFDKRSYINESFMISGKEELNRILDNELVNFYFQPIIEVQTGTIHAYEALMRPMSETLYSPMKFLQIASLEGKLWKVEKITFFKTLFLYKKYKEMFNGAKIFINSIPIENLTDREYFEIESLYSDCLPNLVVEITEQQQQEDEFIHAKLEKLHSLNVTIALDDYGSGYANDLSLLNIQPNIVKIDRSLITNVHIDPSRQTIIEKIITFCKKNNITVLGEGVETEQEFEYMINAGIDLAQGYYISRPMDMPEFDSGVIEAKVLEIQKKISEK